MEIAFVTHCYPTQNAHGAADTNYGIIKELINNNFKIHLHVVCEHSNELELTKKNPNKEMFASCSGYDAFSYNLNGFLQILKNPINFFYPKIELLIKSYKIKNLIQENINNQNPNIIFVYHWFAAAPVFEMKTKKILITGDLLHVPLIARTLDVKKLGIKNNIFKGFYNYLKMKWITKNQKKIMIKMLKNCDQGGSFGFYDSEWLRINGYLKSKYYKTPLVSGKNYKKNFNKNKFIILTGLGNLNATSTYSALNYIDTKIYNYLEKKIPEKFEIRIAGRGSLSDNLKNLKNSKNVKILGYVDDLDYEISKSNIVLLPTTIFIGFRSRNITIFSNSSCVVGHKNDTINMPEMIHDYNCICPDNEDEISELIINLYNNQKKIEEIGLNARKTYEKNFEPKIAIKEILKDLERL